MVDRHPMKLGNKVKSSVYNIEGIAVSFYHHSPDRLPQICVQPVSSDMTKVADAQYMDINLVDYVDDGCIDRLVPLVYNPFKYGDKVKERISGYTGIVTGWIEMMNGCIDIQISPDALDKDGKVQKSILYEIGRVEFYNKPRSAETISDKHVAGLTDSDEPKKKSLGEKVKDVFSPTKQQERQETGTTDPAKRPAPKTGSSMHRGADLKRSN